MAQPIAGTNRAVADGVSVLESLNGPWHRAALGALVVVVVGHLTEHVLQAIQIFALGWPRPAARGALGLVFPWLVTSETLHYAYALVILIGLIALRPGFAGRGRRWWNIALVIQVWHHFEHLLLISQVIVGANLLGSPVPTSILQLFFPRVELHLVYNALVSIPMAIALYYHVYPPKDEARAVLPSGQTCTCARRETVP